MTMTSTWDKHQIKAEIGRKGQTLSGLGALYGLTASCMRTTLARKTPITAADQAISQFLKIPLHVLWPDRYDDKGHRLVKLKPPPKPKRPRTK